MKIKVTLQQEIEYDSEDFLFPVSFDKEPGLYDSVSSCKNADGAISVKDLKIGDRLAEEDWDGHNHLLGNVVSITEIVSVQDQSSPK